jgi:AcrR family transcriptional regulator
MREIVTNADAPRGSLQHYFPGGKEELVSEALLWMGGVASRRVGRHAARLKPAPPSALLAAIVDDWKMDLTTERFAAGCPLTAAAADMAGTNDQLRDVLNRAFAGWLEPLGAALLEFGVPEDRAPGLALVTISAVEGAIILARIRRDVVPLDALVAELGPVLDSATSPPSS